MPNRQIHISHGTLLEMVALSAPSFGYRAEIELLPDGELTREFYGKRATGTIRLVQDKSPPDPLAELIPKRRSSRLAHAGGPSADEVAAIVAAATRTGVTASVRTRDLHPVTEIVKRAMAVEAKDKVLYGETLDWFRFSAEEVRKNGDGLNLQTSGADTFAARAFRDEDNFLDDSNVERFLRSFDEVAESPSN